MWRTETRCHSLHSSPRLIHPTHRSSLTLLALHSPTGPAVPLSLPPPHPRGLPSLATHAGNRPLTRSSCPPTGGLSLRSRPPVGRTAPRVSVTREGAGPPVKRASRETEPPFPASVALPSALGHGLAHFIHSTVSLVP